ncbi:MAG: hypothetical protein ABWX61_04040 [Paenisporosarcina sp.]
MLGIRIQSLRKITALFGLWMIIHVLLSTSIFAAMDPGEIKKRHSEAPFHITGEVVKDELVKDLTEEKDGAFQLRKMTIAIDEVIKSEATEAQATRIEVFYAYLPSWRALDYVGGKPMDITVNDVIEIWLNKGQYGWEPVLSGYSVEHIKYINKRNEPIPEPFFHFMERTMESNIQHNTSAVVIIGIVFVTCLLIFTGLRKRRR